MLITAAEVGKWCQRTETERYPASHYHPHLNWSCVSTWNDSLQFLLFLALKRLKPPLSCVQAPELCLCRLIGVTASAKATSLFFHFGLRRRCRLTLTPFKSHLLLLYHGQTGQQRDSERCGESGRVPINFSHADTDPQSVLDAHHKIIVDRMKFLMVIKDFFHS